MLKGKGNIIYSVLKLVMYALGFMEYLYYFNQHGREALFAFLLSLIVFNSYFRQFILYGKDRLHRFGKASVIFEFAVGICLAYLKPIGPIILMLTPTIFDSVAEHSLLFGSCASFATVISLMVIDILSRVGIYNYLFVFRTISLSYGIGFVIILVVSYLAGMQFRERERIAGANRELEQTYRQLLDHASRLQELSVEKERNRMAGEIHDTLAHTLTAIVAQLEACRKLVGVDAKRAAEEIEKAQESARAGLHDVKRTIKALRPQALDNHSLTDALLNLFEDIRQSAGVSVNFQDRLDREHILPPSAEVALFRIVQESITNAIRHGDAKTVSVSLEEKDGKLHLCVSDNGKGCAYIKEGYGLKGIAERVRGLGGTVRFISSEGKGFTTRIAVPCKGGSTIGH